MTKAAISLEYEGKAYAAGAVLPEKAVKEFEVKSPYLLASYIELNGRWRRIDDPLIKGFVEANKTSIKRLKDYFGITDKPVKEVEDRSHMLRARPKPEEPKKSTEEELFALTKSEQITLLKKLGESKIPKYEKDRVNKILELQNG